MEQYKTYLKAIIESDSVANPARDNMPPTFIKPNLEMKFDLTEGIPILTGKKMPFYSIAGELIGFMKGVTDVRRYSELGCNVWWDNAYNWNIVKRAKSNTISAIPSMEQYKKGLYEDGREIDSKYYELGAIYSRQWTKKSIYTTHNDRTDYYSQLENLIYGMVETPYSRYHVIDAWKPEEMNSAFCSQPNCHVYFQTTCYRNSKVFNQLDFSNLFDKSTNKAFIDLFEEGIMFDSHLTQRSCDAFLGVPFNITSYSLFTILIAILTKRIPREFSWFGVNNHVYGNHLAQVKEYSMRNIHNLPKIHIEIDKINTLKKISNIRTLQDLKDVMWLVDYKSEVKIEAPLSVGM